MPSFSIVTIVYNGIDHILETIDSITSQSYKGQIEYIIIDGASTDGTKEAILNYYDSHTRITLQSQNETSLYIEAIHLTHPTLSLKFLSEKDKGIYDAMNKGISLASKEWINFMNCGDKFTNPQVLEKIAQKEIKQYDVLYGDTEIFFIEQNFYLHRKAPTELKLLWRLFSGFNHQSFFFKTSIHKQNPYNTNYKFVSDYNLIYYLFISQFKFKYLNMSISIFGTGGSSDIYGFLTLQESLQVARTYNPFPHSLKVYAYYLFAILKKSIKLYAPSSMLKILLLLLRRGGVIKTMYNPHNQGINQEKEKNVS